MAIQQRNPERERFWRTAVADQIAGGLSIRVDCQRNLLAESAFHDWWS